MLLLRPERTASEKDLKFMPKFWTQLGFEPQASRTLSENDTTALQTVFNVIPSDG